MAGTYVGMYDTTAANNTATGTGSVSIAEGMAPSNVNNAMRDIMADIRQWYNAAEWIEYGDGAGTYTPAQTSGTQFTIASVDVTAAYHVGRRVKAVGSSTGTIYGSITATSFSTNTTITVAWDSGSLSSETLKIYIGIVSASNTSLPETTAITGDYTLDVSGDIILDADGGDILFKDAGTTFGSATNTSGNLIIKSGTTTALTFSGANATIAGDLTISGDDLTMATNTSGAALIGDGTNFNPVAISGDLTIGTDGAAAIGSGVIVNADVNSSAAIADSKLATISTAGKVDIGALEIDGATEMGAGIVDADLFIIDDGAGGTEKSCLASRIKTYIGAPALTGSTNNTIVTVTGASAVQGEANFTYDSTDAALTSSTSNKPVFSFTNTNTDANGSIIKFIKDAGEAGAANDISGLISFYADDADQNNQEFGRITGRVVDATSGGEEGALDFYVAEYDGTVTKGMEIKGLASDGNITVDVSTHDGAAGGLMLGGTLVTSSATELNLLDGKSTVGDMSDLTDDSSPQLAASLDILTYGITSSTQIMHPTLSGTGKSLVLGF